MLYTFIKLAPNKWGRERDNEGASSTIFAQRLFIDMRAEQLGTQSVVENEVILPALFASRHSQWHNSKILRLPSTLSGKSLRPRLFVFSYRHMSGFLDPLKGLKQPWRSITYLDTKFIPLSPLLALQRFSTSRSPLLPKCQAKNKRTTEDWAMSPQHHIHHSKMRAGGEEQITSPWIWGTLVGRA